jgi:hypothetical protein
MFPGASLMLSGVDHLTLLSNHPKALLTLFTEVFELPLAWPFESYGFFSSGGVFAQNLQIEVVQKESWSRNLTKALSFKSAINIHQTRGALLSLGLDCLPVATYQECVPNEHDDSGLLWSTINQHLAKNGFARLQAIWSSFVYGTTRFQEAAELYIVEYHYDASAFFAAKQQELERTQGWLGVEEFILSSPNLASTQQRVDALLSCCTTPIKISLLNGSHEDIVAMKVKLRSLKKVTETLQAHGICGEATATQVQVQSHLLEGFQLIFVE